MLDDILNALQQNEENLHAMDMDGDGTADTYILEHSIDTDGDGLVDTVLTETFTDFDHDSQLDYYSITAETDTDGDGVVDHTVFLEDSDGDSFFDSIAEWDAGEDGIPDMETSDAEVYNEFGHFNPLDMDGIIGNPSEALDSWHMQADNTCAIVSQEFILENLLDREFDEGELRAIAEEHGWYDNGTSMEDVGRLLEYYGIDVEQSTGNTLDDLRNSLLEEKQIIVGLDADEIWSGQNEEMFGPGMDANHAVQVIGIDESNPDDIRIILNDSGVSNGQGVMVPADLFMDAWEDSGCFMVEASCDAALRVYQG